MCIANGELVGHARDLDQVPEPSQEYGVYDMRVLPPIQIARFLLRSFEAPGPSQRSQGRRIMPYFVGLMIHNERPDVVEPIVIPRISSGIIINPEGQETNLLPPNHAVYKLKDAEQQ